jgi:hypothetical protein
MSKENFQDVVPPERRSVRQISIDRGMDSDENIRPEGGDVIRVKRMPELDPRKKTRSFVSARKRVTPLTIGLIGLGSFVLIFFLFSMFFSGAVVAVNLRQENLTFDELVLSAYRSGGDGVKYELLVISGDEQQQVQSTGSEEVKTKAKGTIVIYNDHSEEPMRLIPNTRFESTDGHIYRIESSVTVPGKSARSDGRGTPGSVEAVVTADEVGEKFNIGMDDFTIPGLQGTPMFEGFYARSKTPIEGGYDGVKMIVSDEDLDRARQSMQTSLRSSLIEQAKSEVPQDFIFFGEPAAMFSFESMPATEEGAGGSVAVRERAIIYAIIFDQYELSKQAVIKAMAEEEELENVSIKNIQDLQFVRYEDDSDILADETFTFSLDGEAVVVWRIDEKSLRNDLLGVSESNVNRVFSEHVGISSADVRLRPFWKRSLPKDPDKIKIEIPS